LRSEAAVLVIVDVLSFSTVVDVAVGRGAFILPYAGSAEEADEAAGAVSAILAHNRGTAGARYSLSPASVLDIPPGTRVLLPSPNGAALSLAAGQAPVLTACLRNAKAVAEQAIQTSEGGNIGVVPAGERWSDGSLRPAIEDWLGAGAVIDALPLLLTPEARVARDLYRQAGPHVRDLVRDSVSGRELVGRGYPDDVEIAL
jgi:2-phosphosulfolactate phosphatase